MILDREVQLGNKIKQGTHNKLTVGYRKLDLIADQKREYFIILTTRFVIFGTKY